MQEYRYNILRWEMGENEELEQTKSKMNSQIYKLGQYFCTHDTLSTLQDGIENITRMS